MSPKNLGVKRTFCCALYTYTLGAGARGAPEGRKSSSYTNWICPSTFSPAVQYAEDLVPLHGERKFNSSAYPISQAYIISQEHFQLSTSLPNPQFSCCIGRSTRNIYRSLQLTKCDHNPYNPFDTNILKFAATRRM